MMQGSILQVFVREKYSVGDAKMFVVEILKTSFDKTDAIRQERELDSRSMRLPPT